MPTPDAMLAAQLRELADYLDAAAMTGDDRYTRHVSIAIMQTTLNTNVRSPELVDDYHLRFMLPTNRKPLPAPSAATILRHSNAHHWVPDVAPLEEHNDGRNATWAGQHVRLSAPDAEITEDYTGVLVHDVSAMSADTALDLAAKVISAAVRLKTLIANTTPIDPDKARTPDGH